MSSVYEGKQDEIRDLKIKPELEVFHNVYEDVPFVVRHEQPEFTSVCPKTGLPDFGVISIEFVPDKLCIELKSLKLHLNAYRNVGIFMENSVNKIAYDIVELIHPKKLKVIGTFRPRGGIQTTVSVLYEKDKGFYVQC